MSRIQVFDPQQEYCVVDRRLPHWSQAGTLSFITWRTCDSIPRHVLAKLQAERNAWLMHHGIDPTRHDWRMRLARIGAAQFQEFQLQISDRWNDELDACHGACVLRQAELSQIVADSLLHFDGDRYELTDFVVMPNHVHLLATFPDEVSLLRQCESWKHFTATKINKALNRSGHFWQEDGFDHLVRSVEQFRHLRSYIADNASRAKLASGEFVHWSRPV